MLELDYLHEREGRRGRQGKRKEGREGGKEGRKRKRRETKSLRFYIHKERDLTHIQQNIPVYILKLGVQPNLKKGI